MAIKYDMAINKKIRDLRKEKNFNQDRISEMLGMKKSTYSQMERSGKFPIHIIVEMAKILEVDILEMIYPDAPKNELIIEQPQSGILKFEQPPAVSFDDYCTRANSLSNREENAIIMLRNLKPEDRESVYSLIKEYHDKRLKRK